MRHVGIVMWICGVSVAAYAMFIFDPSVEGGMFGGRIVNLALQQQQTMMMICGAALFAAGVVLHAFAITRPRATADPTADRRSWWRAYRDEVARIGADADRANVREER